MPGLPRTVDRATVEIATEAFGHSSDPATVMVMGATASMLWWPDAFCQRCQAKSLHYFCAHSRSSRVSPSSHIT